MEEKNIPTKDDSQKAPSEYVPELFEDCVPMLVGMAILFTLIYLQKLIMPSYTEYDLSILGVLGGWYILRMAHDIHRIRKNKKKGIQEEDFHDLHLKYEQLYGLKYFSLYVAFTVVLVLLVLIIMGGFKPPTFDIKYGFLEYFGLFLLIDVGKSLAQVVFSLKEKHQLKENSETK